MGKGRTLCDLDIGIGYTIVVISLVGAQDLLACFISTSEKDARGRSADRGFVSR